MTAAMWMFGIAWALIVYTYVGFPLVLAAIARFLGRTSGPAPSHTNAADRLTEPPDCPAALPSVAMVVAAFNEEAVLAAKLANTWAIDYPSDRFELWVGSDGSTDNTDTILSVCRDARLRFTPFAARRGKISVLNDLMAQVDADIVVMSDANTSYAPDAVHKLVAHFADSRVGCASCRTEASPARVSTGATRTGSSAWRAGSAFSSAATAASSRSGAAAMSRYRPRRSSKTS